MTLIERKAREMTGNTETSTRRKRSVESRGIGRQTADHVMRDALVADRLRPLSDVPVTSGRGVPQLAAASAKKPTLNIQVLMARTTSSPCWFTSRHS
jgi:hypothetical protein